MDKIYLEREELRLVEQLKQWQKIKAELEKCICSIDQATERLSLLRSNPHQYFKLYNKKNG